MKKSRGFEGEMIIEIPRIALENCQTLPLIRPLHISRLGFYPKAMHHYFRRPDGISQVILIYCTDGKGWVQISGNMLLVQAGEMIAISPGTPHSYGADSKNPWSIYWLHLNGVHGNAAIESMVKSENQPVRVGFSEERNRIFKQIATTLLKGYSASNLLLANLSLAYYLATFIAPEHFGKASSATPHTSATERAVRYMQDNLSNAVTLDNIAHSAHLSVSFFSRKFKEDTGYAPIEYYNHLRIQKACQLLHFSDLRINEVASQIGINDPFYFSRLFKQQMGMSPVNYRKNKGTDMQ